MHFSSLFMKIAAATTLAAAAASAWTIPTLAPFVTERKALAQTDFGTHGLLAFVVRNETGLDVRVDFAGPGEDQGQRVDFSPAFSNSIGVSVGPFKVSEKKIAKDVISDSIALFALPAGTYAPRYLYARKEKEGQMPGRKIEGEAFIVRAGEITNLGTVTITAEMKLLSRKVWLSSDTATTGRLEAALKALPDSAVAVRPVRTGHVAVAVE